VDVSVLGGMAVVSGADCLGDPVGKARLRGADRTGFVDGARRREGACGQGGDRRSDCSTEWRSPCWQRSVCSGAPNIAEGVGVCKAYPTGEEPGANITGFFRQYLDLVGSGLNRSDTGAGARR
jgi:hypothetical protein